MTERDSESLLPMLSTEVEHVVRFTPAWRGYARPEVDAFVTRSERELSALRARVEDLEVALRDTDSRQAEAAAEAARWRSMYEDSVPPFEELGARVAEILGLADSEARDRVRAAEDEASTLVAEAGVRAASMVTEAEQRAAASQAEAEQRSAALVADAEQRAAEVRAAAEDRAAARETEASQRVEQLEQEHADLMERLSGIREVLSRLPGLGGAAVAPPPAPADTAEPEQPPSAPAAVEEPAAVPAAQEEPAAREKPAVDDPAAVDDPEATQLFAAPVGTDDDTPGGSPDEPQDPEATVVGGVTAVEATQVQAAVTDRGAPRRRR